MNPVNLANAALAYGIAVQQQIALSEAELRRSAAWFVLWLFAALNLMVVGIVIFFNYTDVDLLSHAGSSKLPSRVIDSRVVMVLVASTTVQLGAFVLAIANYLFPKPERPSLRRRLFG